MRPLRQRNELLYAALVIAAIVVITFSVIGIAIMTDMVPGIQSPQDPQGPAQKQLRR